MTRVILISIFVFTSFGMKNCNEVIPEIETCRSNRVEAYINPICDLSWAKFVDFYYNELKFYSKLKRNLLIQKYNNKKIQWKGRVLSISDTDHGVYVCIGMGPKDVCDVHMVLENKEDKEKFASNLDKTISFEGILNMDEEAMVYKARISK